MTHIESSPELSEFWGLDEMNPVANLGDPAEKIKLLRGLESCTRSNISAAYLKNLKHPSKIYPA